MIDARDSRLTHPAYQVYRDIIRRFRDDNIDWSDIRYANKSDEIGLMGFLRMTAEELRFPEINVDFWYALVESEMNGEMRQRELQEQNYDASLVDSSQDNGVSIPTEPRSSWQLYKQHLGHSGFSTDSIRNIEKATVDILRRLSIDTRDIGPRKGLVIGQVQSGKTANMAALMAMAADWGWNFFVVLSGTIENLRIQTQSRLLNDLNHPGNLQWIGLNHLSAKSSYGERAMDLRFEEDSVARYFNVCLKNSRRLRNLIEWMRQDPKKMRQMKVLVIDDEADQASINTADISEKERKAVNDLIVRLVEGEPLPGRKVEGAVRAMNYISYTATPYANFLNDSAPDSLYPRHFIWTLPTSDEYFGPKQIFGYKDENDADGLDIVRIVSSEDLKSIGDIHSEASRLIPKSLEDAFCWFLCATAARRLWGHREPVSMLIHTSRAQVHHDRMADVLRRWMESTPVATLLQKCSVIWEQETQRFTIENFKLAYPGYRLISNLMDYPKFEELEPFIRVLCQKMTHIFLDEHDEPDYHDHIHLCIDNCSYNKITEEGEYVRLAFPDDERDTAPAFVVIGGSTLSRGLTIKGLVSTYFTRDAKQADSLMQMGRWFGYRRNYEMLPRIWLTEDLYDKFTFLTELEMELRKDLYDFMKSGAKPTEYGPRVKNTPRPSWLRVTAANKMQSAVEVDIDFTGTSTQTTSFLNDLEVMQRNILVTEEFITGLNQPSISTDGSALVYTGVPFERIVSELLMRFSFGKHNRVFNEIEAFSQWVLSVSKDKGLTPWNVIVAGVGSVDSKTRESNRTWRLKHGSVGKVSRTRKIASNSRSDVINIGVLGAPRDLLADIPKEFLPDDIHLSTKRSVYQTVRKEAGLDKTPQLIIYRIDKDSRLSRAQMDKSNQRADLNAEADIIGMWIHIPSSSTNNRSGYARKLTIRLDDTDRESDSDWMEEQ